MSGEDMSNYTPKHPLPAEIQDLPRGETVCQFCGVSYLIHNEIKSLEDKLKAKEEELAHFRGMGERESRLKEELNKTQSILQELKKQTTDQDLRIATLNDELQQKGDDLSKLQSFSDHQETLLQKANSHVEKYRNDREKLAGNLQLVLFKVKEQKETLKSIQQLVHDKDLRLKDECNVLSSRMTEAFSEHVKGRNDLQYRLLKYENEKAAFTIKEEELNEKLHSYEQQLRKLQDRRQELETQLHDVSNQNKLLSDETELSKEQLRKQNQEIAQVRSLQQLGEEKCVKLERDINQKENDLESLRMELQMVNSRYQQQQKLEEQIKKKATASNVKSEEMNNFLTRARADVEALKKEREMMINAHQNQIEQLRESFKKRIWDLDKWPEKMEAALAKERQKHAQEMKEFEEKLKENFVMELQIEKQKHQEMLDKYLASAKDSEIMITKQLETLSAKNRSEVSEYQKNVMDIKQRNQEAEDHLRDEISSLKNIIQDLEVRLGKLDNGNEEKVNQLQTDLVDMREQLLAANEENTKIKTSLALTKEEVTFLQDTVRRECEERFELTEALSQTKEELLSFKRVPSGYSTSASGRTDSGGFSKAESAQSTQSAGSTSSASVTAASWSDELAFLKRSSHSALRQSPRQIDNRQSKEPTPPNNWTVGYEGNSAKLSTRGPKGASMSESRRRIAQAVGRR